mmetsp:Transcript_17420/g.42316  ORF Transcript_17420/g.42316 Transcript_17420/m.42316 type:complete len:103 (+) Transcript_17420:86-394(+)
MFFGVLLLLQLMCMFHRGLCSRRSVVRLAAGTVQNPLNIYRLDRNKMPRRENTIYSSSPRLSIQSSKKSLVSIERTNEKDKVEHQLKTEEPSTTHKPVTYRR